MEIVFFHSLPLNGSMWHQQQSVMPRRSHAPTLYGLGDTLSEWAESVLDRVQSDRLIVVGNSIGGSCAMEMGALAAGRIAAIVLVGAKAGHRPEPMLQEEAIAVLRRGGVEAAWDKYWGPMFSPQAPSALVSDAKRMAIESSVDNIAKGVDVFHTSVDRHEILSTLTCPVLCISGEHDTAPGVATTARQAEAAPDGRLIVISDCGHYVSLEQPKKFNAILRSLIDELR